MSTNGLLSLMKMVHLSPGTGRSALVLCALLAFLIGHAQRAPEHAYTILFSTPIALAQEKFIHEALRSQDPDAQVWINAAEQNTLARVHAPIDRDLLQADLAPCGLVITYFGRPISDHPHMKSLPAGDVAMPVFKDSGDPAVDNARYEVEKKAWVEAHPAAYQQLTAPE